MTMTLEEAVKLTSKGFYIVPVHTPQEGGGCSCGSAKCSRAGKHPRIKDWPSKATSDPKQLKNWWGNWSHPNIGIVTGQKSGVIVLDIDGPDGEHSLSELETRHGALPATLSATTGRGQHRYFKYPDAPVKCSAGRLGKGLDIRADGGFAVCPPSLHAIGKRYQWVDESTAVADAPSWLLDLLTVEDVPDTPTDECFPQGQRNDRMYEEVCNLFKAGLSIENVLKSALLFNLQKCDPALPEEEVSEIVDRTALTHNPSIGKHKSTNIPLRWFQFDATEILSGMDYQNLTDTQLGWRTRLLAYAWLNQGKLPNHPDRLARLANASSKARFNKEWALALFDFEKVVDNGRSLLVNRKMEAEFDEKQIIYEKRRQAGKARHKKQEDEYFRKLAAGEAA